MAHRSNEEANILVQDNNWIAGVFVMTTRRRPWSREETLLVLNLYCRIPFGRQHSKAGEVIELALAIGRTPGSVAMKLNNFTSLDPEELARGVKGLSGATRLDRDMWNELHQNWEAVAAESEFLWGRMVAQKSVSPLPRTSETTSGDAPIHEPSSFDWSGITEDSRVITVRLAQGFFRRTVLAAYAGQCCISGMPMQELLVASHILPWADYPEQRTNPRNGLCLSRLHDTAFDRGLITFDDDYRLVLSKKINDHAANESVRRNFTLLEGKMLRLPEKFYPNKQFLSHHREFIFCSA